MFVTSRGLGEEQILGDSTCPVYGNGEADADAASARGKNRAVDPDDVANGVYQRTTGVSGIDRRVRLDHVDIDARTLALCRDVPACSTYYSDRHARLGVGEDEAVRVTDGDRPLTDHEVGRGSERCDGKVPGVDLQDR